jgi:hypothetical protein
VKYVHLILKSTGCSVATWVVCGCVTQDTATHCFSCGGWQLTVHDPVYELVITENTRGIVN